MKKSFTLIEILVVVFIIAMMSTIAVVVFSKSNYTWRQNDNNRRHDLNQFAAALEEFKSDHGHYPFVNWKNGFHAYSLVSQAGLPASCNGSPNNYLASKREDPNTFAPGTPLMKSGDQWCDDVSLQLLGKAYLTKMAMPIDADPNNDDAEVISIEQSNNPVTGYWITDKYNPNDSRLQKYVDDIPLDPAYGQTVSSTTTDYTPVATGYSFRYFYNSYYDCVYEGITVGDRYWLNAIMQQMKNNEKDSPTGFYFYEIGNMNLYRQPPESCQ